jgi:hypothetical protein
MKGVWSMTMFRRKSLKEPDDILKKRRDTEATKIAKVEPVPPAVFQHTADAAGSLSQADVLQLQHTVGNQAVEQLLKVRVPGPTAEASVQSIQRSAEQEEDLIDELCPGSKIRSAGQGRGEGTGEGRGPIGYPKDEEW